MAVSLSPKVFRRVAGIALGSLCVIVVTGALVRLTGSGLGCDDWPRCNAQHLIDVSSTHSRIEQINRLFTGVVSFSVIGAVLLAHLQRPRRSDHVLLAWSLVGGVVAQIVVGGVVVLTGLNPYANMAHFLISMVLVASAFLLYRRTTRSANESFFRTAPDSVLWMHRILCVLAPLVLITGTVVTATGPHAGNEHAVRFGFALKSVARVHSGAMILCIATLIWILMRSRRLSPGLKSYGDALNTLLYVMCGQAAIGYAQYFTGVPVALVAVHVAGATAFWLAVCNLAINSD
jgi:cytochrome c oxidase assembly protein subunit 15